MAQRMADDSRKQPRIMYLGDKVPKMSPRNKEGFSNKRQPRPLHRVVHMARCYQVRG